MPMPTRAPCCCTPRCWCDHEYFDLPAFSCPCQGTPWSVRQEDQQAVISSPICDDRSGPLSVVPLNAITRIAITSPAAS